MNEQMSGMNELERATRAMEETRWSDAIPDLRTIHDRTPDNVDVAGKLGFALSRDERYGDAISVFERLSVKHPKEAKWPYMVGYQYYQQKEWAQAIDWFARALALRPTYVKVLYRKGYAHTAIGQEPEATKALIECITSWEKMSQDAQELDRSSYGKAQFQLGKLYLKKGLSLRKTKYNLEFKQAQEALERITETLANLSTQKTPDPTKDNEGVIESYNESRGFRFINSRSHERLFFHVSSFAGNQKPARGSRVTFSSESSPKGLRAVHVELAEK